jgi:hypothetical protein
MLNPSDSQAAARLSPGRSEDSCAPPRGADAVLRGRGPTSDTARFTAWRLLGVGAMALAMYGLLPAPVGSVARAGVTSEEQRNAFDSAAGQAKAAGKRNEYLIRCWQYGVLLFEETSVGLPTELDAASVKLRGTDLNKSPLYVAETHNATCLVRAVPVRMRNGLPKY